MRVHTLVIVGVGLIGGSVALAARRRGAAERIIAVDRDAATLQLARERGIADETVPTFDEVAAAANLVLFCTPVDVLADEVILAARQCQPGTILTDAASTKVAITRSLAGRLPADIRFVGGHPLAGSEKQGLQHADAELFRDRVVVLTPAASGDERAGILVGEFWEALGARVRRMSPEQHDHALALTSHLPHLVASALSGAMPPEVAALTSSGFRDTTRIAASDPALWRGILEANATEVLNALARFEEQLGRFRTALRSGNHAELQELLTAGRDFRAALDRKSS
jgi:cyclohexadieny/prephenate dehydrogenase